jgi:hypothetical protein
MIEMTRLLFTITDGVESLLTASSFFNKVTPKNLKTIFFLFWRTLKAHQRVFVQKEKTFG